MCKVLRPRLSKSDIIRTLILPVCSHTQLKCDVTKIAFRGNRVARQEIANSPSKWDEEPNQKRRRFGMEKGNFLSDFGFDADFIGRNRSNIYGYVSSTFVTSFEMAKKIFDRPGCFQFSKCGTVLEFFLFVSSPSSFLFLLKL
ncbi:hypothetical protein TNIN_310721 [Trichonephila inaurata madagascariensis]|uniref:Uncharacterized protein n=1 Tax=Trichonephila inaurata madagascariensis TaxID=2747483 RepID=A0A8X6YWA9_9ARAC|nr:hypothetical protein TNIN_310721 [Trichonephila inaurata madagascariensis]